LILFVFITRDYKQLLAFEVTLIHVIFVHARVFRHCYQWKCLQEYEKVCRSILDLFRYIINGIINDSVSDN